MKIHLEVGITINYTSKLMITDVEGNTAEDEKTIEERVKETFRQ